MLAGTLANDPATGDTSFQLDVKHANRLGRLYAKATNPVTVSVDAKTRYGKDGGSSTLDALAQNDRARVLAKVCGADVKSAHASAGALPLFDAPDAVDQSPGP